jgi:hypothetical protein
VLGLPLDSEDFLFELLKHILALGGQFHHCSQIRHIPRQLRIGFDIRFQPASLLQNSLSLLRAAPEIRLCRLLLKFEDFRAFSFCIKDNPVFDVLFPRLRSVFRAVPQALRSPIK